MAHNIGCMFYFGEIPWHRLGKSLPKPATLEEAIASGGLDWQVGTVPLATHEDPSSPVPHRVAVVREDRTPGDPSRVLGVVHPEFRLLQNRDGATLFDQRRSGYAQIPHRRLPQAGRSRVAARASPGRDRRQRTGRGGAASLYTNSHDGSSPSTFGSPQFASCATTRSPSRCAIAAAARSAAATGSSSTRWPRRPTTSSRSRAVASRNEESFRHLAAMPCDDAAFRRFLANLLPDPAKPDSASTGRLRRRGLRDAAGPPARRQVGHRETQRRDSRGERPARVTDLVGIPERGDGVGGPCAGHGGKPLCAVMFGAGDRMKAAAHELATTEADA